jgi:hypothetical protein
MATPKQWTGGCQCGAVRYTLTSPPTQSCICHCRMCQKASGQPFMAFAKSAPGGLRWTRGAPATFRSSSVVVRGFCRECGTPLTFQYEDDATWVMIGTLDDPAAVVPAFQCGVESELAWCVSLPQIDRYETNDHAAGFSNYQHPDHDT